MISNLRNHHDLNSRWVLCFWRHLFAPQEYHSDLDSYGYFSIKAMTEVVLARRVKPSVAELDGRPRLVVGLDFGTTWSGFVVFLYL